jgi:hypothetical protein
MSRRHLLRGAGAAVGLPLLEAMARAQTRRRPRRFVGLLVPNGSLPGRYFPARGGERDFEMPPLLRSLAAHRGDLLILKGLDNAAAQQGPMDGHREGVPSFLGGHGLVGQKTTTSIGVGPTIDQVIAATEGRDTRLGSLQLGYEGGGGVLTSLSWAARGVHLPNEASPRQVFARLFGDGSGSRAEQERRFVERRSVLDGVGAEYGELARRLAGADRERLEVHLESIRDVELRMSAPIACQPPAAPEDVPFERWPQAMMDLIALAFACDVTRVVTMVYRHPGGGQSYFPFLGLGGSYWRCPADDPECDPNDPRAPRRSDEHHEMSHEPVKYAAELDLILDWHYRQLAYLIERLKAARDGAGTLFDGALLMQGSEIATGPHTKKNMPYLLAGSAGGALRTGRYLDFGGVPHNGLLVSILHAFGVEARTVGHAELCKGPLPGLA